MADDAYVADTAEQTGPRDNVPSDREREAGIGTDYVFRPLPPQPRAVRTAPWTLLAQGLRSLDPRGIAGDDAPLRPLLIFGVLATMGSFDTLAFGFLLFYIKADMHFDFASLNGLLATAAIGTTIAAPVAGWLADRWSRVWMVRVGAVVTHGGIFLAGVAPGPGLLVLARLLSGLGPGISLPAMYPLLSDYYPLAKRLRVFAFLGVAGAAAASLLFLLLIFMFLMWGVSWRWILLGSGVISLGLTSLLFLLREPVRGEVDRRTLGAPPAPPPPPVPIGEAWRSAAGIRTLKRLWLAQPFLVVGYGIGTFLFYALQNKAIRGELGGPGVDLLTNPATSQYVIAVFSIVPALIYLVVQGLSAPLGTRLMRVRPGRIMVWLGGVTAFQALALLGLVFSPWLLPAIVVLWIASALTTMVLPIQNTLLSAIIPARIRGLGFQTIAPFSLIGFLIQPVIGAIADSWGLLPAVIVEGAFLLAGAWIVATGSSTVERDIRAALAASLADEEVRAARARGSNKLLVCRDLDVTYEGTTVLFHVDLDIEEGELVAVLGTNGAGKSTLLRAISGVQTASNGAIFIDGEDVTHKAAHLSARDGVVFLPGGRSVFPSLSVRENLHTAAWLHRDEPEYVESSVAKVLEFFPVLKERWEQQAGSLSGGEQHMLALGQAFCMRPRLLMIDELSLGLAPAIVERLLGIVRSLNEAGTTIILVEQSVNVAVTVARRAVFLDKGQVRFDGPTTELLGRRDLVRSVFLGGSGGALVGPSSLRIATGAEERETVLRAEAVALSYGAVRVLDGVDITVHAGEVIGIVGPNGAGKTSLFDVLSGVVRADSGSVFVQATDVSRMPPDARARLGLLRCFQDARLFGSLTVRENIAIGLERRLQWRSAVMAAAWLPPVRRSERRAARRVERLVEQLRLGSYADKFVAELSTGTRRMVELACALAAEPRVLLLDEPSSGLAQAEIETLGPTVRQLARESGCGVVCIEHDIPLITQMSDRIVALELGRVIAEGTPHEVVADRRVISAYLTASDDVIQRSGALSQALAAITEDMT